LWCTENSNGQFSSERAVVTEEIQNSKDSTERLAQDTRSSLLFTVVRILIRTMRIRLCNKRSMELFCRASTNGPGELLTEPERKTRAASRTT